MQSAIDRYDLDAATDAFLAQQKKGLKLGEFFTDRTGIRWKYVGHSDEQDIASHGEFGIVMTRKTEPDGSFQIETELKRCT